MKQRGYQLLVAGSLFLLLGAACGGPASQAQCADIALPDDCTPSFSSDYNTIYKNVFSQRCGTSAGSMNCHGSAGNQGNLSLADPDGAYAALLGMSGSHARVVPGDPACSLLMERLESNDPKTRMPRGEDKLAEGARCAIQRWIAEGAAR